MILTRDDIKTGAKSAIGTSAVQLTTIEHHCLNGISITADKDNSGTVYVGLSGITAGTVDATDGIPLEAKDSVFIEIEDIRKIYVIGSAAGQKVWWLAT